MLFDTFWEIRMEHFHMYESGFIPSTGAGWARSLGISPRRLKGYLIIADKEALW